MTTIIAIESDKDCFLVADSRTTDDSGFIYTHPDIKIVFASIKIPKPLVKSELRFNTVINLGYYRDLHYSMSVLLQSTPNIVYYNNKHPHGVNVCPQQS
jgi:hypothetical protein